VSLKKKFLDLLIFTSTTSVRGALNKFADCGQKGIYFKFTSTTSIQGALNKFADCGQKGIYFN